MEHASTMSGKNDGDSFCFSGAIKLAEKIREYWIKRGFPKIKTQIVKTENNSYIGPIYVVRSNTLNGFPPR
jgi:hypothetical protein